MTVKLPKNYRPKESEKFMNPKMREYFRQKLLAWKSELQRESGETLHHLQEVSLQEPDIADRASLGNPSLFTNNFEPGALFDNEPTNTFLVKLSYWFSI